VAYEIISAALFTGLFAPYALLKMIGAPAFRMGIRQRLSLPSGMDAAEITPESVWIQAVSLGEVKSVAPLVHKISVDGATPVFLTSTTETGFRAAEQLSGKNVATAYFPLDFSPIVNRVLSRVRPRAIVLFETEIWPNLIRAASSLQIPISIVNGRISEKSRRYYAMLPWIFKHVLSKISFAGMQSQKDAERIIALGARPEAVDICGNVKFDSAPSTPPREDIERLRAALALEEDAPIIVAGSTHEGEETAVLNAYRKILAKFPRARLVLAPRHPERFDDAEAAIRRAGLSALRRSNPGAVGPSDLKPVALLDTIGELAYIYSLASVSFVGGSLAKIGGHNIIEPASMGKPVVFGPFMHHFEDVKEAFLSEGAAICVGDEDELHRVMQRLLEQPEEARALGEAAKRVVATNRGATDRYFEALKKYL
jgi:3-deoxy-D-manno-octulosonic-acid transferase